MEYFDNRTYEKQDYKTINILKGNYENCLFSLCDFSNSDLSGVNFTDCRFENCNLSMTNFSNTQLNNIIFSNCKMLGMKFEQCNPYLFKVTFYNCLLNLSSYFKVKLKKTHFKDCTLHEVDFTETELNEAVFDNCDLKGAIFSYTHLEKADFRTAYNYSIHPETNRISKAKFSRDGIAGLLDKYNITIE